MNGLARLKVLVGSPMNFIITAVSAGFLALTIPALFRWGVVDAVWTGSADACRAAAGACWTYVGNKLGFFFFGFYPADERWRPLVATLVMIGLLCTSLFPRFWGHRLVLAWPATMAASIWLLGGGPFLRSVPVEQWSGLALTVLIATFAFAMSMPIGILLALGRTSSLPFFRFLCASFIELQRALPLVTTLFMASVLVPLLVPAEFTPGKLVRAYIAFTLIISAYIAEIVRGGLRAVPSGQAEAARALGLQYWQTMRLIVLPQCLRVSIPSLVGVAINFFKETSLVMVIGLTDFLGAVAAGAADPAWLGYDVEGYVFAAAVYFCFCFGASRYSIWLEKWLRTGANAATGHGSVDKQLVPYPKAQPA